VQLDQAFMMPGGFRKRVASSQKAVLPGFRIPLAGVETVSAGFEFAYHTASSTLQQILQPAFRIGAASDLKLKKWRAHSVDLSGLFRFQISLCFPQAFQHHRAPSTLFIARILPTRSPFILLGFSKQS
jgi:hypothetical protein